MIGHQIPIHRNRPGINRRSPESRFGSIIPDPERRKNQTIGFWVLFAITIIKVIKGNEGQIAVDACERSPVKGFFGKIYVRPGLIVFKIGLFVDFFNILLVTRTLRVTVIFCGCTPA